MSRKQRIAMLILSVALPAAAHAQFDLNWYTIDAGGAMFTAGGAFELSGTIGQPDAGSFSTPLAGGNFELVGGFWPIAAGCACTGDLDGDCVVSLSDLTLILSAFGCCSPNACFNSAYDINGDGCIDLSDLAIVLSQFGTNC